jgi:hypothetical protein
MIVCYNASLTGEKLMGLLDRLKHALFTLGGVGGNKPKLTYIGTTGSVCPFCEHALKTMPEQSQKCPHCGEYVYVRSRPIDERKILVTESQIQIVDEQWAIADGTYEEMMERKHNLANERVNLNRKSDLEKSLDDVRWTLLQRELLDNKLKWRYGSYRNTLVDMGKLLVREARFPEALSKYLDVCYLDLNGTTNVAIVEGQDPSERQSPFVLELARTDPSIIAEVRKLAKKLDLPHDNIQTRFLNSAKSSSITLQPPVMPEDAWIQLSKELFD